MNLSELAKNFSDETKAREFLESILWPSGTVCPHCGVIGESYRLTAKPGSKTPVREGVWKCGGCRKQFTVRVGTIFEDSKIPLHKWLQAIHLLCASKKGMSSHQIHRMLGITYKSAWFLTHRIRYAMQQSGELPKLDGTVEIDETYVGGKVKGKGIMAAMDAKTPVVSLVQRGGKARSFVMEHVTAKNLRPLIDEHVHTGAQVMTDDAIVYPFVLKGKVASHDVVNHSKYEYVRREKGKVVTTNSVEGFFSILKRGIVGTFHHVSKQHLDRYLSEFDFRYNSRDTEDADRAVLAIDGFKGKRLMYRPRLDCQK